MTKQRIACRLRNAPSRHNNVLVSSWAKTFEWLSKQMFAQDDSHTNYLQATDLLQRQLMLFRKVWRSPNYRTSSPCFRVYFWHFSTYYGQVCKTSWAAKVWVGNGSKGKGLSASRWSRSHNQTCARSTRLEALSDDRFSVYAPPRRMTVWVSVRCTLW